MSGPLGVAQLHRRSPGVEELGGVLTHDFLEPVGRGVADLGPQQVLVGQGGQHPRHVGVGVVRPGDLARGMDREACREHRAGCEHRPLVVVDQVHTPRDGGPQRPLSGPLVGTQQLQGILQCRRQSVQAEQRVASRRQFDREGHAFETCAQRSDPGFFRYHSTSSLGTCPEEEHTVVGTEGRYFVDPLIGGAQPCTAGGHHRDPRAVPHESADATLHVGDQVLAIVEYQQPIGSAERRGDCVLSGESGMFDHADGHRHRLHHGVRVRDLAQVDEPPAVRSFLRYLLGHMNRQPGLADAAGPGHRHHPVPGQPVGERGRLLLAAQESAARCRPSAGPLRMKKPELLGSPGQTSPVLHSQLADQ